MQTLSANQTVRRGHRPSAGCQGSTDKQATVSANGHDTDGFLKHSFLPLYEVADNVPEQKEVEQGFFKSLAHLQTFYGIETLDVANQPYPYNILLTQWDINRRIKKKDRYRELQVNKDDNWAVSLAVNETISTGNTLFYIPLKRLCKALQDNHPYASLLLTVCTYLYREAGVPHYREDGTFMQYLYEILENWTEDERGDMEEGEYDTRRKLLNEAYTHGDETLTLMSDKSRLTNFAKQMRDFKPGNAMETACLELAQKTLTLWQGYPGANLHRNLPEIRTDEEDDYYGNPVVSLTDYVSFIAECDSELYDSLMQMVNDDFNERPGIQEPEKLISFETPVLLCADPLAYEQQVFDIINGLCELLNELP